MTTIIIVAGGLATRMRPITEEIPKCLVDINGKPLIEHQLLEFKRQGYTDIIFCVAHLADKVKDYFKDGTALGMDIKYVEEQKELMGTAGSVKLAESLVEGDFIVYYGDNLTNMDLSAFLSFHKTKGGIATVVMRPLPPKYKSTSIITLDLNRRIKAFIEKPSEDEFSDAEGKETYINSGIYAFRREVFSLIPPGKKHDFAKELFPRMMTGPSKEKMFGYVTSEFFREIGRVEKYEAFVTELKGKQSVYSLAVQKRPAVFIDRDGVINENLQDIVRPDQFRLLPGVGDAIRRLNMAHLLVVVVTNQPVIAKGLCSEEEMKNIHKKLSAFLVRDSAKIDAIYICPHHPERGFVGEVSDLKVECDCRKPKPGLLFEAARVMNIDLTKSWLVGDSRTDILAGKAAGVRTILVKGGGALSKSESEAGEVRADMLKRDLADAVSAILSGKR